MGVTRMRVMKRALDGSEREAEATGLVNEQLLPASMRDVLEAARASRPDVDVICISFYSREDGEEIARMGARPGTIDGRSTSQLYLRLHPKDLLVLSVAVTETTFETVRTVTHVLVARARRRMSARSGAVA